MTFKQTTFSAIRWTTLSMLSKALFQLLQMVVLARLLTPSDFGLMAMVVAVISFAQIFSDLGVSNAIIHHQEISEEQRSSLYWLNVLASVLLMLLLMTFSPFIVYWYNEPKLQPILMIVASTFFIVALSQQLRVMAEKHLRFRELAMIEVTASLLGFIAAVLVAYGGGGVYALIAGSFANVVIATVLHWVILTEGWRPLWRLQFKEIRKFIGFGAYMIGYNITNTFNLQADILIGGRLLGPSSLGVYSLPKELSLRVSMVINPIVTRVGLPMMASAQSNQALLKSIYLKTLLMTASVNFPVYFLIIFFAPEIVAIMFGAQWQEATPLLRILALWALIRSTGNPSGSLVFSMGRADLAFWWSLGMMCFFAPVFWLGSQYGVEGLALSALISMLLIPLPQWLILIRPLCGAQFFEYFKQLAIPFIISGFAAATGFLSAWPFETNFVRLGAGIITGGVSYLALSFWLNKIWFGAIAELILGRARSTRLFV